MRESIAITGDPEELLNVAGGSEVDVDATRRAQIFGSYTMSFDPGTDPYLQTVRKVLLTHLLDMSLRCSLS